MVIQLKTFSRLGYFPALDEVPAEVTGHIRRGLRLPEAIRPVYASTCTAERHRNLIRARSEVVYDPAGARKVAAEAIEEAARRKNDPADLINIALERLVEGSYELPAFRTLNDMAATIRARVNEEIFAVVAGRLGEAGVARLQRLLVTGAGGKSEFYQLSRPARRPSWSKFREQLERQRWIEGLGDARAWWQGVAPSKIADFAGEAAAADAAVMSDYSPAKRIALVAALVFTAQASARDDTAEMFCRRVGTLAKRAREELEALKDQHREITERLVAAYRSVLEQIDPDGEAAAREQAALEQARKAVETAGGFTARTPRRGSRPWSAARSRPHRPWSLVVPDPSGAGLQTGAGVRATGTPQRPRGLQRVLDDDLLELLPDLLAHPVARAVRPVRGDRRTGGDHGSRLRAARSRGRATRSRGRTAHRRGGRSRPGCSPDDHGAHAAHADDAADPPAVLRSSLVRLQEFAVF